MHIPQSASSFLRKIASGRREETVLRQRLLQSALAGLPTALLLKPSVELMRRSPSDFCRKKNKVLFHVQ